MGGLCSTDGKYVKCEQKGKGENPREAHTSKRKLQKILRM